MKVSEVINYLQDMDPDEEIVIAWWGRDWFGTYVSDDIEQYPDDKTWVDFCSVIDNKMDWSSARENVISCAEAYGVYLPDGTRE